ncbi:MAG: ABC transporter permease [Phycisphaerales bacterium]|nr:ABC transporter permease [Phycisphaerales bacterium]
MSGFFAELIREAVRNLARHKLRSLLTTLGIVFGVASVLSMVALGEGARQAILRQIQELGIRNIIINAVKPPETENLKEEKQEGWRLEYGLKFNDAKQIRETLPMVADVLEVRDVERWIWFKSRRLNAKIRGVTPEYFDRLSLRPFLGRVLDAEDARGSRRVCVVRADLLRQAAYVGDPLKLDLKIGSDYFRVVGVLPDHEFQSETRTILGIDDRSMEVYVPFHTVVGRFGVTENKSRAGSFEATRVELHQIVCTVRHEDDVLAAARGIQAILTAFHPKRDYQLTVPLNLLEQRQKTQQVFNIVLPIIAGISLLVGGIGILNIMLASITERTREIGIRRAIGASGNDITWQFLIETVTLAMIGGIMGVIVGVAGVFVLRYFTEWQAVITTWSLVISLLISCLTGILFGLYPARRAAAMDPIRALRHN